MIICCKNIVVLIFVLSLRDLKTRVQVERELYNMMYDEDDGG